MSLRFLQASTGTVRADRFDGRHVIVVPVVALRQGVFEAGNSDGPELVPLTALRQTCRHWNGRPIVLDHPMDGSTYTSANTPKVLEAQSLGTVFNTRVVDDKLVMDAWIDQFRANQKGLLQRLKAGDMFEVSVGVFVTTDPKPGVFEGKPYDLAWKDITPDHLAFLNEGRVGACSIEAGCGSHRNASGGATVGTPAVIRAAEGMLGDFEVGDEVTIDRPGDDVHGKTGTVTAVNANSYSVEDENGNDLGAFNESELRAAARILHRADGYALATAKAPRLAEAADDPDYNPFGIPADGYAIALARQKRGRK